MRLSVRSSVVFPDPERPEEDRHAAGRHVEVDVLKHDVRAEGNAHVLEFRR